MINSRKRLFFAAFIFVLADVAAYWYWSPFLIIRQMRSDAINADADSFNDHVDYPKLRESLKGQLSVRLTGEFAKQSTSGNDFERAGTALGSMLGLALVDRMIDALVRPEMVMQAMENGKFQLQDGRQQERSRKKIREIAAQTDISALSQAVQLYQLDHGHYPTEQQGLQVLVDPTAGVDGRGAYVSKLPKDPWGRPYQYVTPGKGTAPFEIYHLPVPEIDEETAEPSTTRKAVWRMERKGLNKIIIYVSSDDSHWNQSGPAFVMRRDGFANWKLTEIRLPE